MEQMPHDVRKKNNKLTQGFQSIFCDMDELVDPLGFEKISHICFGDCVSDGNNCLQCQPHSNETIVFSASTMNNRNVVNLQPNI